MSAKISRFLSLAAENGIILCDHIYILFSSTTTTMLFLVTFHSSLVLLFKQR